MCVCVSVSEVAVRHESVLSVGAHGGQKKKNPGSLELAGDADGCESFRVDVWEQDSGPLQQPLTARHVLQPLGMALFP